MHNHNHAHNHYHDDGDENDDKMETMMLEAPICENVLQILDMIIPKPRL